MKGFGDLGGGFNPVCYLRPFRRLFVVEVSLFVLIFVRICETELAVCTSTRFYAKHVDEMHFCGRTGAIYFFTKFICHLHRRAGVGHCELV